MIKVYDRWLLVTSFLFFCGVVSCVDPGKYDSRESITPVEVDDWRDEVIYQILVDRFADGDINNNFNVDKASAGRYHGGDWQGIIDKLGYLEDLGVTAIWISPVVKNVEEDAGYASYHGYWTQSFKEVNPHFGDLAKLRELVDECHKRDIKVVLDIVTNHIGPLFYYDINGNGRPDDFLIGGGGTAYGSENDDFSSDLTRTSEWDPEYDSRGIQGFTSLGEFGDAPVRWVYEPEINRMPPQPPEFQNPEWYNRRGRVTVWRHEQEACRFVCNKPENNCDGNMYWWDVPECRDYIREQEMRGDFPGGLKDLDTTRQDVRDALFEVFAYWIDVADFDAFRIDTLKHVDHGFWRDFCPRMRSYSKSLGKSNFFMFGEAFDGNDELLASYVGDDQVDSVFYFSQKYIVYNGIFISGNPTRQIETLWKDRLGDPADPGFVPIYPDTPNAGGPVDSENNLISPRKLMVNFIDNHDVARFRFLFDDTRAHHNALFLLMTQDGIPCIYYGTEQRFSGGNDPDNREDMWLSGFDRENGTFRFMKTLIQLRKDLAPLRRGDLRVVWSTETEADGNTEDAGIFAFERIYRGETVLVVVNTSNNRTSRPYSNGFSMQTSFASGTRLVNLLCEEGPEGDHGAHICSEQERNQQVYTVGSAGSLGQSLDIPPRSGVILVPQ